MTSETSIRLHTFGMQIIRLLFYVIPSAETRSAILKKTHYFAEMGDHVHFQPRKLPADPQLIRLHNNIAVTTNVGFITHDLINRVFRNLPDENPEMPAHYGCIEIMDNVFIGAGTKIMPNVRIGPNAIVAAGSVVTKDVLPGSIVGGDPARVIGSFDELLEKRRQESVEVSGLSRKERTRREWEKFFAQRE